MPIASTVVWIARSSAASANNGGGFKTGATGVNYANQDSPQYALTGLTSVGAGNTILSAAAAADMVGNVSQAISGTNITPGFFEVVSVIVGVSITFSTNSAAASICTGIAASGVINIGGALNSWAQLFGTGVMAAGQNAYVKGSFTITATVGISFAAGTGGSAIGSWVEGFTATTGDGGQSTLTTATNSIDLVAFTQSYGLEFRNITSSSTAGTRGDGWKAKNSGNSGAIGFRNCIFDGFSRAIVGNFSIDWMFTQLYLWKCQIKNCVLDGGRNSGVTFFDGVRCNANGGHGWLQGGGGANGPFAGENSIFDHNTTNGFEASTGVGDPRSQPQNATMLRNCAFTDNGQDGAGFNDNNVLLIENCIFYINGRFGLQCTDSPLIQMGGLNAFGANVTSAYGNLATAFPGDITLTADPFTARNGNDFSLNAAAGGGAACNAAGFPGVLQSGGTGFASIGPLQPQATVITTITAVTKRTIQFMGKQGSY